MSETLTQRLERYEGRKYKRYKDSKGYWTIGIGHNLDEKGLMCVVPDDRDLDNEGITDEEINIFLFKDVSEAMADLRNHLPWFDKLDEARQDVLLDMTFNMGIGSAMHHTGLLGFPHMLAALESGDYEKAADELKDSTYYNQVGQRAIDNYNLLLKRKEGQNGFSDK